MQTSGDQRREKAKACQPSLRAQRSNPRLHLPRDGLLRFARNDDLETAVHKSRRRSAWDIPHAPAMTALYSAAVLGRCAPLAPRMPKLQKTTGVNVTVTSSLYPLPTISRVSRAYGER